MQLSLAFVYAECILRALRYGGMVLVSFAAFLQSIASEDLKAVAVHWNAARGPKRMPAWGDIKPSAIARQLPIVWSYRYDAEQNEFIGRLGGDKINRIFGRSIKNAKLSDLVSIIGSDRLIGYLNRVVREPALQRSYGSIFSQADKFGFGERIIMPLAADGILGDGVLGASHYREHTQILASKTIPDEETWFSLENPR